MTFTKGHQKTALTAMIAILALLNGYRYFSGEQPKTAPLAFPRGMVAPSPVRQGLQVRTGGADPLSIVFERSQEQYPGVIRDIFRMDKSAVRPRSKPTPTVVVSAPPAPFAPVRTPEEIAADLSRAELSKFRYLGYLTEKDNTLFLSKDGELFIVKSGDRVLNIYKVGEVSRDTVVILDTVTRMERRVDLSGDGTQQPQQRPQQQQQSPSPPPPVLQRPQQVEQQKPQPTQQQAGQPADRPIQQRRLRDLRPQ